jgi:hypothetical protein
MYKTGEIKMTQKYYSRKYLITKSKKKKKKKKLQKLPWAHCGPTSMWDPPTRRRYRLCSRHE